MLKEFRTQLVFKIKLLQPDVAIPPENIRKPSGFLMFSGGIDKQHRAAMG